MHPRHCAAPSRRRAAAEAAPALCRPPARSPDSAPLFGPAQDLLRGLQTEEEALQRIHSQVRKQLFLLQVRLRGAAGCITAAARRCACLAAGAAAAAIGGSPPWLTPPAAQAEEKIIQQMIRRHNRKRAQQQDAQEQQQLLLEENGGGESGG
jgi:hypothetical protein